MAGDGFRATIDAMNADQLDELRTMLTRFISASASDDAKLNAASMQDFLARVAHPWRRATLEGHLTASAWVLDRTQTQVVMLHHRKLNRWLQPGGHIDDTDESWRAAAMRELTEETGLTQFVAQPDYADLFDVDVHVIPARKDEPTHLHYDLRFLFVADVNADDARAFRVNADESHDCRWFPLTALANDTSLGPETHRMIELSIRRLPITGHL
jgi:8-oxo-dGTP pyrophosphatase MutT (NUDIX family)